MTASTTLNTSNNVESLVNFLKATEAKMEQQKVDSLVDVLKQSENKAPVSNVSNVVKSLKEAYTTNKNLFFKSEYKNSMYTPCLEIFFEGESEKAVKFNVKGNFVWIPKSALTVENGVHLVVKPWFKLSGYAAKVFERYSFLAG
tara:strand:+ start:83 stop:514 length:432 start_codon:yes stop_codon:yes gene_type:complete